MADGILACDAGAVFQAGADMVREVAVDCGDYGDVRRDACYCSEKVDGAFEGAGE